MGGSERNVPAALSPPGWGLGLGSARAGPVSRGAGFAPPSLVASCAGRAGLRRGLGSAPAFRAPTLRVTDWPQSPAGLLCAGLRLDRAGQRLASNAGRAVEVRGSSGTWVGRGRAGVPPHKLQGAGSIGVWRPCVQFAAGAPRHDPTPRSRTRPTAGGEIRPSPITRSPTVTTVVTSAGHKDPWGTVCLYPSHRRDDADETQGRGRVGVPPQQTAHTAALKRLTPHPAVCEEVPRPGPARPTRRTTREPHSPAGV